MQALISKLFSKRFRVPAIGILIGTAGGFMYYYFIGCKNGTCPITSSPWLSILWGAAVGYLLADMITGKKKSDPEKAG